jgi:molecular chaperone DnaK
VTPDRVEPHSEWAIARTKRMMMSYLLGIDLGTTRTSAAVAREGNRAGEVEMVTLGDRSSVIPSVLYLAPDGSVVVGEAAERRAVTDPDRVVREFKRRLGDPTPMVVAGRPWTAEELSSRLVRWVVDRVAEREGGPASRIAVTHPASWGGHKKELLSAALANQGLSVTFLAEPQAAALHYAAGERVEAGSTIAVYDLGGGTFDAAVVRKVSPSDSPTGAASAGGTAAGFALLGRPEGLERLGGVDFDEVVFEHVRAGLPGVFDELDETDPGVLAAVARVRRECTEAKEALSSDTEVSVPVLLPGARGSVRLHRGEFEGLIRPQIEETVSALRRAVSSAGLAPEQLTAVLLVGGSSRIPLVAQLVSEQLGRPVAVDADPKNAIAKGAALSLDITARGGSTSGMPPVPSPRGGPQPRPPLGAAAAAGLAGAAGAAGLAAAGSGPSGGPPSPGRRPGPTATGAQQAGGASAGPTATGAQHAGGVPPGPAAGPPGPGGPPPRPSTAPPTQRIETGSQRHGAPPPTRVGAVPPQRHAPPPADRPPADVDDAEDGAPRGRRSPAMLVSAGGLVAAIAVVGAIFVFATGQADSGNQGTQIPVIPETTSAPVTTEPPVEETRAPVEQQPTRRPAPPPATAPPPPPPTTVAPPPTTDPPPPTTEPEPPVEPPPPDPALDESP